MNDEELLRYSRQILLPEIDLEGQEKLRNAGVLIIGMGGLGCPAAMYLASAGIGTLTLSDHDRVDLSNLQRQIAHGTADIGIPKVLSARHSLKSLNPDVRVIAIPERLSQPELERQIESADVVLDCSDNFSTRFSINRTCVAARTPLVSGAAIRFEAQLTVFTPGRDESPCYNCLYPELEDGCESCTESGVIAPLPGVIGSLQALEAIKLITGAGKTLVGRVLLLDALTMEWNSLVLPRNHDCATCSDPELTASQAG